MDLEYKEPCLYVLEINQHRSLSLHHLITFQYIPHHSTSRIEDMAACVPKHTENPLPAFQGDRLEHYAASTTYESATDS
jgi:hypothetical protein